ncbi:MAG: hypothetical protein H4O13_09760 [Xanthomonadales bacterium]|nr:hypothetical protein [Xanthomonadales bacterium]
MDAQQIDAVLAEVAEGLAADQRNPLAEAELQALQRRVAPFGELLEKRWRQLRPGGPERLREAAAGRSAEVEALAEHVRRQREQLAGQLELLGQLRRTARRREALQGLPQAYSGAALAVAAAEAALASAWAAMDAVNAAAQTVAQHRRNAGDACPDAPVEAEALPPRLAAMARQIGERAHGVMRWPEGFADSIGVEDATADARHRLGIYANV